MFNLYRPIYEKIEQEIIDISYYILFDDWNLPTYSLKNAELILRMWSEIENICRDLLNLKYHEIVTSEEKFHLVLKKLQEKIIIYDKEVIFSYSFANFSEKIIKPFTPFNTINKKGNPIVSWYWYDTYNNLKHDRNKYLKDATIKNLLEMLAALFLVNIYFLDKKVIDAPIGEVEKYISLFWFSKFFSPKILSAVGQMKFDYKLGRETPEDISSYTYLVIWNEETLKVQKKQNEEINQKIQQTLLENPQYKKIIMDKSSKWAQVDPRTDIPWYQQTFTRILSSYNRSQKFHWDWVLNEYPFIPLA